MNKLNYTYVGSNVLDIDLGNDYIVRSVSKFDIEDNTYYLTLQLTHKQIELYETLQKFNKVPLNTDKKTINKDILTFLYKHESDINEAIENYEYMLQCFDIGNNQIEEELGYEL